MKKSLNGKQTNTCIEDKHDNYGFSKKMKVDQILCLNSISFDTIKAYEFLEYLMVLRFLNNPNRLILDLIFSKWFNV